MRAAVDSLRIRAVVPEAFAVLRTSWHELLLLGLLLFVPLGLLTALAPGDGIEVDGGRHNARRAAFGYHIVAPQRKGHDQDNAQRGHTMQHPCPKRCGGRRLTHGV